MYIDLKHMHCIETFEMYVVSKSVPLYNIIFYYKISVISELNLKNMLNSRIDRMRNACFFSVVKLSNGIIN